MKQNLIGGQWTEGVRTYQNTNPSDTRDVIGDYAVASREQALEAVAAAHAAFPAWSLSTPQQRFDILDAVGNEVNLEKALRLADRLGGHLVTGHVDGVGEVVKFAPVGESHELVIRAPAAIAGYIAKKGSITVNGVSLTVNRVEGRDFWINLIPHTVAMTNLKHLQAGSKVNLEIDLIARYVERMLAWRSEEAAAQG